jgi:uncharacterized protein with FMN-binding domain
MKTALIIIGIVLLIGMLGFVFASFGLKEVRNMVIKDIDLAKVPDGVFTGKFHKARWHNEVEVTVRDHRLAEIKSLNKLKDAGSKKIVDGAIAAMLAKQSVQIDAVSGASVNTKAFQKAVENALTGKQQ